MPRPGPPGLPHAAARALLGALLLSWACSLALPVAPAAPTSALRPCALAGTWANELGARMTIWPANSAGHFSGSYRTAVTSSGRPVGASRLWGSQQPPGRSAQPAFGLAVQWARSESVTVFAGQCFVDADGRESLETTWLLRREAAARAEDWKATLVGRNVFVRVK